MSAASPDLEPVSRTHFRKPKRKVPVVSDLTPAQWRQVVLWVLVILCQLGYPVGPMLAQLGVPIPVNPSHAAHAPAPTATPLATPTP